MVPIITPCTHIYSMPPSQSTLSFGCRCGHQYYRTCSLRLLQGSNKLIHGRQSHAGQYEHSVSMGCCCYCRNPFQGRSCENGGRLWRVRYWCFSVSLAVAHESTDTLMIVCGHKAWQSVSCQGTQAVAWGDLPVRWQYVDLN